MVHVIASPEVIEAELTPRKAQKSDYNVLSDLASENRHLP
jgi:hypothetical protein